jgi:hypothetical protein
VCRCGERLKVKGRRGESLAHTVEWGNGVPNERETTVDMRRDVCECVSGRGECEVLGSQSSQGCLL